MTASAPRARTTAGKRAQRILSMIPWIVEHPGVGLDELAARFDVSRKELSADLDLVFMVGVPPYTPDSLVDVEVEDDRVWVRLGDYFRQPIRLTHAQALSLAIAGRGLLDVPGADDEGPLARALAKLDIALDLGDAARLDVDLGNAQPQLLGELSNAVQSGRQVELDYYTHSTDSRSTRVVDPWRIGSLSGHWYLWGWCHKADAPRAFRLDRTRSVTVLDSPIAVPPPPDLDTLGTDPEGAHATVTVTVGRGQLWVATSYPIVDRVDLDGGGARLTLRVVGPAWLARLMAELGPSASFDGPAGLLESSRAMLRSIRGGYRSEGPTGSG